MFDFWKVLPQKQDKQRKPLKRPLWTSTRWNILRYQLYRQWETRFLLCSQVWHSLIFCQSRFSEQRTKTRSRAVWSCFYHEVSKMWVMWNPTICIHNVSRPETDMITVGADINECFIFFKIIYISFWKKKFTYETYWCLKDQLLWLIHRFSR